MGVPLTGCRPGPVSEAAFGPFVVGEFGGVDGRRNQVEVARTGTTLVTGRLVAAGRIDNDLVEQARRILTSTEFRREVADSTVTGDDINQRCSDQVTWSVSMGELRSSIPDRCGSGTGPDRTATAQVISLVRDAAQGRFAGPLGPAAPELVGCRLGVRSRETYAIDLEPDGRLILDRDGGRTVHELESSGRDALRLLLPRLIARPGTCRADAPIQLSVADTNVCASGDRDAYNAVVRLLRITVGV